jgi:hypothetical protein
MPALHRFQARVANPDAVRGRDLHWLVCSWLNEHGSGHAGAPFAVAPLPSVASGVGAFQLGLFPAEDRAAEYEDRLASAIATCGPLQLGGQPAELLTSAGASLVTALSWEALWAQGTPRSRWSLRFLTPTTFRSQTSVFLPLPLPTQVFGSLRRRWLTWAPAELGPELALTPLGLTVEDCEVRTEPIEIPHVGDGLRVRPMGFTGLVTFRATWGTAADHAWLDRLARCAEFTGVGAMTAHGLGLTRYLCE